MPSVRSQTWKAALTTVLVFALLAVCVAAPAHGHADAKDACTICQYHHSPASTDNDIPLVAPPEPSHSAASTYSVPATLLFHRSVQRGRAPPSVA